MAQKNLKILISGDSKPFRQSVDQGAQSMKKFKGEASGAMTSLAQAVGINTSQINGSLSSMQNVIGGLGGAFKGAAGASGILTKAMKILRVALISTGIGALLVALGTLIAYFTGSQRGADKLAVFMAKLRAAVDVVKDRFVQFGEGLALIFSGKFKAGADLMKNAFKGMGEEIKQEATAAGDLEKRMQALEDREIALITVMGERRKKIAQLRLDAKDETKSAEERKRALTEAINLEKQNLADELSMQRERVAITEERTALAESTRDDFRALAEEQNKLNELETQSINTRRRLATEINTLNNEIEAYTQKLIANAKAEEAAFLKDGGFSNTKISAPTIDGKIQGVQLAPVDVSQHETAAEGMKNVWIDATSEVNGAMQGMVTNFGESVGLMIANSTGIEGIGFAIGGIMADMAINVGKMAIGTGLAVFGIKQALTSLNPAVAIAAGVALVALGTAVKAGLSNLAQGGSSPAISGGSADSLSNAGSTGTRSEQKLHIEVTGALTASGRDMAMALSKENVRIKTV